MEVVQKFSKRMPVSAMLDPNIVLPAIGSAFTKLDPRLMIKSPVMFVVEMVAVLTTVIFLRDVFTGAKASRSRFRSSFGCGSRCCLPTSRRRSRKVAAKLRQTRSEGLGLKARQSW